MKVSLDDGVLRDAGWLEAKLTSLDGVARRMDLRVEAKGGLRVLCPDDVVVPADHFVTVSLRVFRGAAPWGTRQAITLVALPRDPDVEWPAAVARAEVQISDDPAWMPHLRWPLAGLGLALLVLAFVVEWRRMSRHAVRP